MNGKIVKGIAGFYYVDAVGSGIYECRAKGIFRKDGIKPLVGDNVIMEVTHEGDREGNVTDILPRKNELVRPAVANVDQALILFSLRTPEPNLLLLDRFLISAKACGIPCIVCINKCDGPEDEAAAQKIREIYEHSGRILTFISVLENRGIEELRELLRGKTTVFAGPSGVGKSSLTNALAGSDCMEVGEISRKLSRGKNTTRHSELLKIGEGTFLCDTPGFSSLETRDIDKEDLQFFYEEFSPHIGKCRFQGCVHVEEPGCAVKEALCEGAFSRVRYENYVYIYEELKELEKRRYQ